MKQIWRKLEGCLYLASSFLYSATGKEVESVMGYCTAVVLHKFYCTDFIGLSKNVNAGQNKAEINEVEVKGKKKYSKIQKYCTLKYSITTYLHATSAGFFW